MDTFDVNSTMAAQLDFLREVDKLKLVVRHSLLMDGSRRENSAEHSWHVALAAMLLAEYVDEPVDVMRAVQMLLVHDIVEIDAGDTYIYDSAGRADQSNRETEAATRLFGLLPAEQAEMLRGLWDEYEERVTPEARFAYAVDRMLPVLHNFATQGGSWREHGVNRAMVVERVRPVEESSRALWQYLEQLLDEAVARGYLAP